jgi:hypothetical protein
MPLWRALSIFSTIFGIDPHCGVPAALRCQISTGIRASRPMRIASSSASKTCAPSERM